ncbi:MAG TPA: hypothetical protein VFO77_08075 [Actinoplanes sp.]|nr:hypothetical protein [Actinoplanes sp.]
MKAFTRTAAISVLAVLAAATGLLLHAAPAAAGAPSLPTLVAYVRDGNVYVSKGATEKRLTTGGGHARPRWSPDGKKLAYLKAGQLWTMKADGTGKRRLSTRAAAGPSWSPDGKSIAFASLGCTGGPAVYRISATVKAAKPKVLFPGECRGEPLPAAPATGSSGNVGTLSERLRHDDAVAWSPDGTMIAFRGGACESIYDDCLSIGTIATAAERTVAAYGGGSLGSGFAVVPSWRFDGTRLSWTAYQVGETEAEDRPVHLVEYDTVTRAKRTVGADLDRELAYLDANRAAVTGNHKDGSWVLVVDLVTGARTAFHPGSQPSVQPVRR